jgi:hypothetical protein
MTGKNKDPIVSKSTNSNDEVLYLYFRKDKLQFLAELLRVKRSKVDERYFDLSAVKVYKKMI